MTKILSRFAGVVAGTHFRKDAPDLTDKKSAEAQVAEILTEMGTLSTMLTKSKADATEQFTNMTAALSGVKADNAEVVALSKKMSADYAETIAKVQGLTQAFDILKKEYDAPAIQGGAALEDADRKASIVFQKKIHFAKGGTEADFREDKEGVDLVKNYRSAVRKLMKVGIESKERVLRDLTPGETKAFDAASLDSGFFMPEMLGIEVDCEIECAYMADLYMQVNVGRTNFMYPNVKSYGDIGAYGCDANCDADLGPVGNIQYLNGRTYDFRGVFCFQKKVLEEANYDLLGFMIRAAQRSYRINRNNAMIRGDGVNAPKGWLTADCFEKLKTAALKFDHQSARRFVSSAPMEYGPTTTVMHQNVFAYLASALDNTGRFIFGDGMMTYNPDDANERIRISNCLPDATAGNTRGSVATPFVAGDFLMATGNWKTAYAAVSRKPMFMEQFIGGTTAWCTKYQFGAEDGGFVACCPAARILTVGA